MPRLFLSKSKYLIGLQCPKLLWVHYNAKEQLPPVDDQTQSLFDQGHEVGVLAQKLFPSGIAVQGDQPIEKVIGQSKSLLTMRKPLFEAGFSYRRGFARGDILNPISASEWDIIEVKSGTTVKDPNLDDVAFQRYCYKGAGIPIRKCQLMHIDNTYVRQGEVDPNELFVQEDVTNAVAAKMVGLDNRLKDMLRVIEFRNSPEVEIGPHCDSPYPCPLRPSCWEHVDRYENNIFTLRCLGAKAWSFYYAGRVENKDIPSDFRLTNPQRIQLEAERTQKAHVNRPAVADFLGQLRYPLYLLDFETFQTAIPLIGGTRPWQQIPFQFSLHIADSLMSEPVHHSWLWDGKNDPRKELLEQLSSVLGERGSIVAFNASFERTRLRECVQVYPCFSDWLEKVLERIVDLIAPFKSFDVYFPSQHGSASIKKVLPALTGKNYDNLAIQEGGQASEEFKRIVLGGFSEEARQHIRKNLEAYCWMDTIAMLDIIRELTTLVNR